MIGNKKIACIIPARLKSTRFPRKMLSTLNNKPLLQWVWEAARTVPYFDELAFAVDSEEIAQVIASFGGKYYMTSESCINGTERLVELLNTGAVQADIWVNWQGDEPFVNAHMIRDLLQSCEEEGTDMWTLKKRIVHAAEVNSPQIAKVVCDINGYALYFSRSQIPYYRDPIEESQKEFYKHVGLYAFTPDALRKISTLPASPIELAEQLEMLRLIYNNLRVRVHETQYEVFGIDLPEHLVKAEARLTSTISVEK
ncbi:MAG: 3-deoxy-manno-octulosonate cytidylyltransferase [Candidatus Melainabacteria bacterium]|nr:3-deoxy-manno-octulosonate cytidylyltransferase [Candidatus Melainabacteria bacterium]